jgi:hypothetical protein
MNAIVSGPVPAPSVSLPCPALGSLPSPALARRLGELCGDERNVQVDFLLHLGEFDARRAWAEAGYGSLWVFCQEVLRLREGAAWRRIEAMKLLRRFPALEPALRQGKLCLTTAILLGPVLSEENLPELVERAAFLSKADTERLVVSIRPRVAPRDGVRRVPAFAPGEASDLTQATRAPLAEAQGSGAAAPGAAGAVFPTAGGSPAPELRLEAPSPAPAKRQRAEVRPVAADTFSLRVTLDAETKAELDQLVELLSHKTGGDLAAVLGEAIRCALAKHGRRKGAVAPERRQTAAAPKPGPVDPRAVPMELKREVWRRDGGRCAWTSADGRRCGSTWRLELGHVRPVALGGRSTVDNVRLECGVHNQYEAVRVFGREHMARFRGEALSPAEVT